MVGRRRVGGRRGMGPPSFVFRIVVLPLLVLVHVLLDVIDALVALVDVAVDLLLVVPDDDH